MLAAIVMFSVITRFAAASDPAGHPAGQPDQENPENRSILLSVECHSGTPPVLEFVLKDPEKLVKSVDFDFESDGAVDYSATPGKSEVIFRGVPYRHPGVYHPTLFIHTAGGTYPRKYEISFIDFRWGVNNFSFANDGPFENGIDFVSKTIIRWAEERFGTLSETQKVVLLYIMYTLYKGSIGRCYGFSGGELYYLMHPEKIPYPYLSTYLIPETEPTVIEKMDYMQNDIVFSNFISKRINISEPQDSADLEYQISKIKGRIKNGKPVVLGYISRKMHHSMLVYGYFENYYRKKITLLTANNWEREQNNNVFSEDAENIVVTFTPKGHSIKWHDLTKNRYRYPTRIFDIEPQDKYFLSSGQFFDLLDKYETKISNDKKTILMVEKTETAYIMDADGKKTGFSKPKYFNEIKDISFKKIDYNYIFEVPEKITGTLVLKKRRYNSLKEHYKEVNLFVIFPANSVSSATYMNIPVSDKKETRFHISKGSVIPEQQ